VRKRVADEVVSHHGIPISESWTTIRGIVAGETTEASLAKCEDQLELRLVLKEEADLGKPNIQVPLLERRGGGDAIGKDLEDTLHSRKLEHLVNARQGAEELDMLE
jgi:hypothetical protein